MSFMQASEASEAQVSKAGFQFSLMDMDFSPKVDPYSSYQRSLRNELADKGVLPALTNRDVPNTSAQAAVKLDHRNLGLPGDDNKSSATAVSRILQASGLDVSVTSNVPYLKKQLEDKGYMAIPISQAGKLRAGDIVMTSMNPAGRNVGIVGSDRQIYSHHGNKEQFTSQEKWNSKFVTVLRHRR